MKTKSAYSDVTCPQWQMKDAYTEVDSGSYLAAKTALGEIKARLADCLSELDTLRAQTLSTRLCEGLRLYEQGSEIFTSLQSFLKCLGAKDMTRKDIGVQQAWLTDWSLDFELIAQPMFARLERASASPQQWKVLTEDRTVAAWSREIEHRSKHWEKALCAQSRVKYDAMKAGALNALGSAHKSLQQFLELEVRDKAGEVQCVRAARLITILKGHPDPVLRHNTARAMEKFYDDHGELWAQTLNTLHGVRLPFLSEAGHTPLSVSLWQNRMSEHALRSMVDAIESKLPILRDSVHYRARAMGKDTLGYEDLLAPCPDSLVGKEENTEGIPYSEALKIISEALSTVSPEMGEFPQMMYQRGWIDAVPDEKKIGGAFYVRFNALKMPRVFSSYTGSLSSVLQQAHELGHAFHYWVLRDLPSVETEFPMTLTESASTFNEALVREALLDRVSAGQRFAMMWQEMRSAANFLLHTMSRWEFEMRLFLALRGGYVSSAQMQSLMVESWEKWYGSSACADRYLWAYKLHFYKTDQWIYNYPYTVGYLISAALMQEKERRKEAFYDFYRNFLRDTGKLDVDGIIREHFGMSMEAFWEGALNRVLRSIEDFKACFDRDGKLSVPATDSFDHD